MKYFDRKLDACIEIRHRGGQLFKLRAWFWTYRFCTTMKIVRTPYSHRITPALARKMARVAIAQFSPPRDSTVLVGRPELRMNANHPALSTLVDADISSGEWRGTLPP